MTETRQLPLFANQPAAEADLNGHTRLIDALPLFQNFLKMQGKTAHTIAAFTSDLALLTEYVGDAATLGWFTTVKLNEFLGWMENRRGVPCSRKTYARRVTTLKVFFKWLREIQAIPLDPANPILQRSGPAPLADILTPSEVTAVMRAARAMRSGEKPDARPELLLRLILSTGMKKSEAITLLPTDIQPDLGDGPQVLIRHEGAKDRYRERLVPVDALVLPLLNEYLVQYKPRTTLFTCTARNLEYILEAVGKAGGAAHKISFEMLRWMFAVRAYESGTEPNVIREWLGLSEISWVETYSKVKQLSAKTRPARV